LRKGRTKTGNNPVSITLSDLDKRILGIIGHDYVQGLSNVPDSFPEEHNVRSEKVIFFFTIIFYTCMYIYIYVTVRLCVFGMHGTDCRRGSVDGFGSIKTRSES